MQEIYNKIEALIGSESSEYNKGVQDALNIIKRDIEEVISDAIWNEKNQD